MHASLNHFFFQFDNKTTPLKENIPVFNLNPTYFPKSNSVVKQTEKWYLIIFHLQNIFFTMTTVLAIRLVALN